MRKLRLLLLLLLLMTVAGIGDLSASKPPPPPLDCSQYNTGSCFYHWDANDFCCKPSAGFCVWHCL